MGSDVTLDTNTTGYGGPLGKSHTLRAHATGCEDPEIHACYFKISGFYLALPRKLRDKPGAKRPSSCKLVSGLAG